MHRTYNYILSRKRHRIPHVRQEPDHYMCGQCATVFQRSDLEFECRHNLTGKYRVKPEPTECPFCGTPFDATRADRCEFEPFQKPKNEEVYGQLYRIRLESRLTVAQNEAEEKSRAYVIKCLADVVEKDKEMIDNFPRTEVQNCFSSSQAIKPQVNWGEFDYWVATHGLPCPVP